MTPDTQRTYATFEAFKGEAARCGFDEVVEREWAPHTQIEQHTHPFSVWAQVTRGELWLTVGDATQHLPRCAHFTLDANVPHSERYGSDGAAYWVARKNAP